MMNKYSAYNGLDLPNVAKTVLEKWQQENVFQQSIEIREGKTPFIFFEGPPSANGLPGIHHVMGRAIKDIFCRYKTLKGFQVKRKAGWDTHGLPVELGVEKELGITKEDIGTKISIEEYNNACKEAVMRYTDVWNDLTLKMGYWVDMEHPYVTYDSTYMESVWWLLKQIYNKDLIYKGYTIQPYSPKAGTGLSSHEVNQPGSYRDVTDTTVVAQFKANAETLPSFLQGFGDIHLLAWTTTPWTLPSNTALTVGPKIDYVLVKTFNQYTFLPMNVVLAKNLVGKQFGKTYVETAEAADFENFKAGDKKIPFQLLAECKGADLVGIRYEQLMPLALPYQHAENAFRVISGDFVTTEDGTGIVHTAPTFGADDAKVAKEATPEVPPMLVLDENGTPVPLVDLQGKFIQGLSNLSGKYVKNEYYTEGEAPERSADVEIAIQLKEENKAFKVEKYVHSYPHCWRTDKPILYYPLDSWFIKVTEVRDRMFDLNETINWKPKATGEGRFGNWLKNANDWNLSRSRYWGIPLPIWRTEDKQEEMIIGSVEELYNEIEKSIQAGFQEVNPFAGFESGNMSEANYALVDLHKNVVDGITLVSAAGKPMKRESDLIDVWFDSGSMPYAQWHYPFENKEFIDNHTSYPGDFIAEGVDQTRGWFYTLHAIATMVFDSVAYKNVVSNGLVLDKNGQKMSKRLGNAVDPFKTLEKYGADATRWYMITNAQPWDNLRFDEDGIVEVQRKFFGTLYNTYSFFALYANIDDFDFSEKEIPWNERPEIDRWVLSKLHSLIQEVDDSFADYEPTKAGRLIQDFVTDQLSNWYVRLCRRRFWKSEDSHDKLSAYQTLYTCLETVAILGAPIAPFFMDQLFRDLNNVSKRFSVSSVHLADYPTVNKAFIDLELEAQMDIAQRISSLVLGLRKKEKIRVRQPLQKIMVPALDSRFARNILHVKDLILSEVNVKELELLDEGNSMLVKSIKPNFKTIGPKYGQQMKAISELVRGFSSDEISRIEANQGWEGTINGTSIALDLADFEITAQDIPGWLVAVENDLTVALDSTITPELKAEGLARDFINLVQNQRKDENRQVTDKVNVLALGWDAEMQAAVLAHKAYIMNEVLAKEIVFDGEENANGDTLVLRGEG